MLYRVGNTSCAVAGTQFRVGETTSPTLAALVFSKSYEGSSHSYEARVIARVETRTGESGNGSGSEAGPGESRTSIMAC